jgi:UDP-N-acetylglucosamine--N-acetylmuramyl-(pentapeptide) pyrophosphoryl-undecaprenol N-acetylglucosamine transferase
MMSDAKLYIVFAGGGTAGHLFPGLAVAQELTTLADSPQITFTGDGKSIESGLVVKAGFDYRQFSCAPMPRGVRGAVRFLTHNLAGYRSARRWLHRHQVSAVVGLGGYASVPVCRAAIANGLPLILLEQNVVPGKATRWLAKRADLICAAFDDARKYIRTTAPIRFTGNPIRAGFRPRRIDHATPSNREWKHRLLVLGGSGGAHSLNKFVPRALYKLRERLAGWQIVHQSGPREAASTADLYRKLALEATVVPFVENLPAVLRRADLAISRAGGTTLAELAASGIPSVLIPYPHATGDHQRLNADVFVDAGGARVVDERAIEGRLDDALVAEMADLLTDALLRESMSTAVSRLARPQAAWQIATMVKELACETIEPKVA